MEFYTDILNLLKKENMGCLQASQCLKLSLLAELFTTLNVTSKDLQEVESSVYVHWDCCKAISKALFRHTLSQEEMKYVNKILTKNLLPRQEAANFADFLYNFAYKVNNPVLIRELNRVFAVDGFAPEAENYRYYVDNLKYKFEVKIERPSNPNMYHVAAVRNLYRREELEATPLKIHEMIIEFINRESKGRIAKAYLDIVGTRMLNEVVECVLKLKKTRENNESDLEMVEQV